jgi:hypothetical protein
MPNIQFNPRDFEFHVPQRFAVVIDDFVNGLPDPIARDELLRVKMPEANGPELWKKLLDAVEEIYEPFYTCVAGGAVRDYLLKQEAKDIDIYVIPSEDIFKDGAREVIENANCLGWNAVELLPNNAYQNRDDGRPNPVVCVFRGHVFGRKVDLIFLKTTLTKGEDIVKSFDFKICQCWWDGEVHQTREAAYDMAKMQWTPVTKLTPTTRGHFDRVNKRYGGKFKLNEGEPWYMKFNEKKRRPE